MRLKHRTIALSLACLAVALPSLVLSGCGSQESGSAPPPATGQLPGTQQPGEQPTDQPRVAVTVASPSTITAGSTGTTVTVTVLDAKGVPSAGTSVTFAVAPSTAATVTPTTVTTDASGVATAAVEGTRAGTVEVTATALGVTSKGAAVTVVSPRILLALVDSAQTHIPASNLGAGGAAVRVAVADSNAQPLAGVDVSLSTTLGTLVPSVVRTDANGEGEVVFTSRVAGSANLKASSTAPAMASGILTITVDSAPLAQVLLVPSPSQIPPDGSTVSKISVEGQDAFGNSVDGTVNLVGRDKTTGAALGLLSPASVLLTHGAAGESDLTADRGGTGAVTISGTMTDPRYPGVTVQGKIDVVLGATAAGEPASIRLQANPAQVSVSGVGQNAVSTVSIEVLDSSGTPIQEGPACSNNLEVMISGGPASGENLQGRTKGQVLLLTTQGGSASATFNSGTKPGTVALAVSVTKNAAGEVLPTPVTAQFPVLTIASGPPFSVTLAEGLKAKKDAAETHVILPVVALVEDVWGNAVPDDTPVSFGLVYNVIYAGSDGVVTKDGSDFVSALSSFDPQRLSAVPPIDTVVLLEGDSVGGYFLGEVAPPTTLRITSTFPNSDPAVSFVVGNSKGGPVLEGGTSVKNGVALINLRYPVALALPLMPTVYLYAETADRQLGAVRVMATPWPVP